MGASVVGWVDVCIDVVPSMAVVSFIGLTLSTLMALHGDEKFPSSLCKPLPCKSLPLVKFAPSMAGRLLSAATGVLDITWAASAK